MTGPDLTTMTYAVSGRVATLDRPEKGNAGHRDEPSGDHRRRASGL